MNDFLFIPDNEHFKKIRFSTIGASDIPIICGLNKNKTPFELWQEKTGKIETWQGNNITEWGHLHEYNILFSYIKENKNYETAYKFLIDYLKNIEKRSIKYKPKTEFYPFTEFIHPEIKFAMAHPDCIDIENNIIIEAKSGRRFANIRRNNMDGFDPEDPSGIPLKYYLQIQWQLFCSELNDAVLRALIDTNEEMTFSVKSSKKIQEKLIDIASRFMYCVTKNKPPMPINSDDIKKLFPEVHEKTAYLVGAESEYANKMIERKEFLSKKSKNYKDEIDDINDALMILIGGNKYLYDEEGNKICSQVISEYDDIISLKEINKIDPNFIQILKDKNFIKQIKKRYIR